ALSLLQNVAAHGVLGPQTGQRLPPAVYPSVSSVIGQLADRPWIGDEEALGKVHPDPLQLIQHRLALHALGDGRDPQRPADLADGFHHAAIDRVLRHLTDELAVDLQEVHRQSLQVHERGQPRAEVIEGPERLTASMGRGLPVLRRSRSSSTARSTTQRSMTDITL